MISFNLKTLFYLTLALTANAQSLIFKAPKGMKVPDNSDFIKLKGKLQNYIAKNPDRHIPLLVRTSFHDLFLQQKGAARGCIARSDFLSHHENAGLDQTIKDLQNMVKADFRNIGFTFGDVVAFAGKVAAEAAYPCIKIPFKFNRASCDTKVPNLGQPATSGFNNTIVELRTTLEYLGGSISPEDMAILFAGAHGIKGARATGASEWRGRFSNFSSGKAFIAKTFSSVWTFLFANNEFNIGSQYFTGKKFDNVTNSTIIRLPSDMIFYPSKFPTGQWQPTPDDSPEAFRIQEKLRSFTLRPRDVFDQVFAKAYGKMLAIGGGDKEYKDNSPIKACPEQPAQRV